MLARRSALLLSFVLVACNAESPADDATTESESTAAPSETETGNQTETGSETETETGEPAPEDPILDADDFGCVLDWPKVRRFRVTNVLGDVDETLAVANSPDGGVYPVGTLIQLVPTEAMVKRAPGFAPQANDWEFFSLAVSASGTEILDRGSDQVVNAFGGNCYDCHVKAEPQWDFVCEQDHGCDPLPFTEEQIAAIQESDPRCN